MLYYEVKNYNVGIFKFCLLLIKFAEKKTMTKCQS